ncbi:MULTISPECIES: SDR family NAD(P)-dependent oxidoreductase [Dickeya]|uniref:3-oxoacyl-[acyl-carrier protein] reductase n=1 Tax=Dickeya aquatica TaxID=1401087 RepID=A0A375A9W8_9GAMM|nr:MULTISPECIES: SDR family oxidoreductase [Dickeya]SLM62741.1 3-oxoacyl-[acyl-carrier protein] reductase [Dickeya aquatica]
MTHTHELDKKRVAIIAGGAKGIGFSTVKKFTESGYDCFVIDRDESAIEEASTQLSGSAIKWFCLDLLNDNNELESIFSNLAAYQSITLVNLIGGSRYGYKDTSQLTWQDVVDTFAFNLKPAFTLIQALLPLFKVRREGRIVNIGSITSRMPLKLTSLDYGCAKSALLGFSRHLSMELAGYPVLVNTVCPGIVGTERIKARWDNRSDDENNAILDTIPLNRVAEPEDIAETIFFLGSENNRYMTGAIMDVNGGIYRP